MTRREFSKRAALVAGGLAIFGSQEPEQEASFPLVLVKNPDRKAALRLAVEQLGQLDFSDKDVYLKPSFNSPNDFPATTHPETLSWMAGYLRERNCAKIALIERSGMGPTRAIWERLGIPDLAKRLDVTLQPLEEIPPAGWRREALEGSHWKRGVEVPDLLTQDTCVVQITNLRTHRFGGHFSASLKNSIGLIAKHSQNGSRHNFMAELHASPDQRSMIAEVNQIYRPVLLVMDATRVFVDGGPEQGDLAYPEVIVASRDRVAMDAVGVALLRLHGAGGPLSRGTVFDQDQLKRAVELGLGARSPKEIRIHTSDEASRKVATQLTAILEKVVEEEKNAFYRIEAPHLTSEPRFRCLKEKRPFP